MLQRIPILAIIGPTGIGKTRLSITLAKDFKGEVISIDSIQTYQDAKIMSGQVTPSEMSGIDHHLIDYLDPHEEPRDFIPMAIQSIQAIHKNGKLPILCGGSLSLTEPLLFHPFIEQHNLMVISLTSQLDTLGKLTDHRIDRMVEEGLLQEVQHLYQLEQQSEHGASVARGVWKCIGYSELRSYAETENGDIELLSNGIKAMKNKTRAYAKCQLEQLWYRIMPALFQRQRQHYILNVESSHIFRDAIEVPALLICKKWMEATTGSRYHVPQRFGGNHRLDDEF